MRTLVAGAGLALTAGLLTGAAMRPDLDAGARPAGPQMIAQARAAPPAGPFDERLVYTGYADRIPDYVLGTDWKTLAAGPAAAAADPLSDSDYAAPDYYLSPLDDDDAPAAAATGSYTAAAYQAPERERVSFPSLDGGAAYTDASRAEATPLAPASDLDAEAPPEAAGDTTQAR